jgi:hypothetical protein
MRPIAIGLFHQQWVAEFPDVSEVRKTVFRAPIIAQHSCVLIEITRLPDKVEGNICYRNILLQHRPMPAPLAVAMAKD